MINKLKPILLVEDNQNDVELILEALKDYNLANRVITVNDGVEALSYLRNKGEYNDHDFPAVVLLDIKMPRMNGIETLREIKKDKTLKNLPVVMLTSSREEPDLKSCYDLGANAYVVKPVDFREFVSAVKNLGIFWAIINETPH
ncbi:MAG: response regulator [Spirochaetales bacterium]|nr:response regulator [Spirochaetales bacterium]